jgi:hypothetical protein
MMKFRSLALNHLSENEWTALLYQKEIFERRCSKKRLHPYKPIKIGSKKLIIDKSTELTWQQFGSPNAITCAGAKKYIRELNKQRFASYKDWRLPTLNEAMSLLMPDKDANDLYINSEFDSTQKWIWTGEETHDGAAWVVTFRSGCCYVPADASYYVRAVRGEPWFPENGSDDEFDIEILAELL